MGDIAPLVKDKINVAIAGGGIAGLALAVGLVKQPHVEVRVYESVPQYRDVGAGLALHLNAIKAMTLIGPELRGAYFDKAHVMAADQDTEMATEVILAHGESKGTRVAELGRAKGRMSIARSDLLDGFWSLLPQETVVFGKKLAAIAEKQVAGEEGHGQRDMVEITFTDGTKAEADVLIGADGVHSLTRSHLLGADHPATAPKNHDNWVVYRTMVSMDEARRCIDEKWCGMGVPILLGPRGHVNIIPLNKGTRLSAGVAVRGASNPDLVAAPSSEATAGDREAGAGAEQKKLDPENYDDYTEEAQKIIRMVARDTSASWKPADHDHAPFYARGPVAMIGDAAHASLPFAGNGAAQALEDAAVLVALFARLQELQHQHNQRLQQQQQQRTSSANANETSRSSSAQQDSWDAPAAICTALRAYDVVRRQRSQHVVDLARQFGRVYAYVEDDGRMHASPERMRAFFADMSSFTNDFDVAGQNREAVELLDMLLWQDADDDHDIAVVKDRKRAEKVNGVNGH
ncbi:hypothetical protein PFICI_13116 [Pestalotiopsis fici W106-1]|uniref:FAD-binding domain-containing protein n=1 Tax=Pestalotiopsis fici (strain W106-1 / CGMCC3.15140) TaxID=1229662 RepID=W3WN93_PESFW|nr:uncharacterized protein PFICI_13116 [Pestalotiopsis fici W106-1]ETS74632.1 hypothetical protein PFICI_13116 [Pestalotiopsis fici W106-1]